MLMLTSATRVMALMDIPSTSIEMICARLAVGNLFMRPAWHTPQWCRSGPVGTSMNRPALAAASRIADVTRSPKHVKMPRSAPACWRAPLNACTCDGPVFLDRRAHPLSYTFRTRYE